MKRRIAKAALLALVALTSCMAVLVGCSAGGGTLIGAAVNAEEFERQGRDLEKVLESLNAKR